MINCMQYHKRNKILKQFLKQQNTIPSLHRMALTICISPWYKLQTPSFEHQSNSLKTRTVQKNRRKEFKNSIQMEATLNVNCNKTNIHHKCIFFCCFQNNIFISHPAIQLQCAVSTSPSSFTTIQGLSGVSLHFCEWFTYANCNV